MRRFYLPLVAVAAFGFGICSVTEATDKMVSASATVPHQADKNKAEQEVRKQLEELREASSRGDTAALEKIYADDAVITFTTGGVGNKAGLLQSYTSGRRKLDSVTIDELKVNVYGDTVVTNSSVRSKGKFRDQAMEEHYRLTTVHVKQQGSWKVIVSNATTIQPRPAQ